MCVTTRIHSACIGWRSDGLLDKEIFPPGRFERFNLFLASVNQARFVLDGTPWHWMLGKTLGCESFLCSWIILYTCRNRNHCHCSGCCLASDIGLACWIHPYVASISGSCKSCFALLSLCKFVNSQRPTSGVRVFVCFAFYCSNYVLLTGRVRPRNKLYNEWHGLCKHWRSGIRPCPVQI